jgi:hypothetical protein
MADITDPIIIRSLNNRWRRRAEQLQALQVLLNNDAVDYSTNITPNTDWAQAGLADLVTDGRTAEGVPQVAKAEITALLVDVLNEIRAILNTADLGAPLSGVSVESLLEKFAVRELNVSGT